MLYKNEIELEACLIGAVIMTPNPKFDMCPSCYDYSHIKALFTKETFHETLKGYSTIHINYTKEYLERQYF